MNYLRITSKVKAFESITHLQLMSSDFMNPQAAEELSSALSVSGLLPTLKVVELAARFGTLEGSARWLLSGAQRSAQFPRGRRWAVGYGDALCSLVRSSGADRFDTYSIDVTSVGVRDVGARIASAAAVLALLGPLGLTAVDVESVPGGRLRPAELDAIRTAMRRVPGLDALRVAGQKVALR